MRKSESAVNRCKTISTVQKLLGGKYKIELLWYIGKCDVRRFGQLRRQIGEITESSLTKQLRELEAQKTEQENLQIIQLVRGMNMKPEEFAAFLRSGAMQAAPAVTAYHEQEDNAHEE